MESIFKDTYQIIGWILIASGVLQILIIPGMLFKKIQTVQEINNSNKLNENNRNKNRLIIIISGVVGILIGIVFVSGYYKKFM